MRITSSAILASAALALTVSGTAQAAIQTITYTFPTDTSIALAGTQVGAFSVTPYSELTSISYTNFAGETFGDTYGSDIFAGVNAYASSDGSTGVIGSYPWNTGNFTGVQTPSTRTVNGAGLGFYAPASGSTFFSISSDWFDDPAGTIYAGSVISATFDDAVIFTPPPPAPAPASVSTVIGGSLTATLAASEVDWYSVTFGGGTLTLNTEGSLVSDTEIGVYSSTGALLGNDDDSGTGNLSALSLTGLPAGTYYVAVGGFNTTFLGNFGATSTSTTNVGTYTLNGLTVVPEPTSLALVGFAATGLLARRRRA